LSTLTQNPYQLSLRAISENIDMPPEKLRLLIHSLRCKGYTKQDSRDRVKWDHDNATYYTKQSKREEVDELIGK
jgi:glutamine amidotransferase